MSIWTYSHVESCEFTPSLVRSRQADEGASVSTSVSSRLFHLRADPVRLLFGAGLKVRLPLRGPWTSPGGSVRSRASPRLLPLGPRITREHAKKQQVVVAQQKRILLLGLQRLQILTFESPWCHSEPFGVVLFGHCVKNQRRDTWSTGVFLCVACEFAWHLLPHCSVASGLQVLVGQFEQGLSTKRARQDLTWRKVGATN